MARPPKADAARTQANILDAASQLFSDRGVDGTSMRTIAQQAGVTQATIHHYFGSKDDLHAAVVASMYAGVSNLRERFAELVLEVDSVAALVEATVREAYRFGRANEVVVRLVMREVVARGELGEELRRDQLLPALDQAAHAVAALGALRVEDVRLLLLSLNFLVIRYAFMSLAEMRDLVGRKLRSQAKLERVVEDHLVMVAQRLLCPGER